MEETLSVSGGVLGGSPASPLLSPPTRALPPGPESSAEACRAKELFLGCLFQKKGQSAPQEQREGQGAAPSSLTQPLPGCPTLEAHSPLLAFTLFSLTIHTLEGRPLPRVVGKGTPASKGGRGDPMTS